MYTDPSWQSLPCPSHVTPTLAPLKCKQGNPQMKFSGNEPDHILLLSLSSVFHCTVILQLPWFFTHGHIHTLDKLLYTVLLYLSAFTPYFSPWTLYSIISPMI